MRRLTPFFDCLLERTRAIRAERGRNSAHVKLKSRTGDDIVGHVTLSKSLGTNGEHALAAGFAFRNVNDLKRVAWSLRGAITKQPEFRDWLASLIEVVGGFRDADESDLKHALDVIANDAAKGSYRPEFEQRGGLREDETQGVSNAGLLFDYLKSVGAIHVSGIAQRRTLGFIGAHRTKELGPHSLSITGLAVNSRGEPWNLLRKRLDVRNAYVENAALKPEPAVMGKRVPPARSLPAAVGVRRTGIAPPEHKVTPPRFMRAAAGLGRLTRTPPEEQVNPGRKPRAGAGASRTLVNPPSEPATRRQSRASAAGDSVSAEQRAAAKRRRLEEKGTLMQTLRELLSDEAARRRLIEKRDGRKK